MGAAETAGSSASLPRPPSSSAAARVIIITAAAVAARAIILFLFMLAPRHKNTFYYTAFSPFRQCVRDGLHPALNRARMFLSLVWETFSIEKM